MPLAAMGLFPAKPGRTGPGPARRRPTGNRRRCVGRKPAEKTSKCRETPRRTAMRQRTTTTVQGAIWTSRVETLPSRSFSTSSLPRLPR